MPSQPRSKLVADEVCRAMCVNGWSCFSLYNMVREHFQFPLALEAGLATILIIVMAIVFVIACRRPLLQPTMLVHAVVQLVPLPCAIDSQHIIQLGEISGGHTGKTNGVATSPGTMLCNRRQKPWNAAPGWSGSCRPAPNKVLKPTQSSPGMSELLWWHCTS